MKSFDRLAPFGMDHKKPVFYIRDFQVESSRTMGAGNSHLKLKIKKGNARFDVVAFGQGHLELEFSQAKNLELVVSLAINQWNGQTTLQLMVVDARVEGVQLYNIRGKNAPLPQAIPLFSQLEGGVESPAIVIDRIPDDLTELKALFQEQSFQAVYFKNHLDKAYYLTGYGTRDQYAKLYKTLYQFPEFDIRHKLGQLSDYLKIPQLLLIKMIQIFQELGFVQIENGIMTVNKDAEKKEITSSSIYQDLVQTVKDQELMALGSVQEIYEYLTDSM